MGKQGREQVLSVRDVGVRGEWQAGTPAFSAWEPTGSDISEGSGGNRGPWEWGGGRPRAPQTEPGARGCRAWGPGSSGCRARTDWGQTVGLSGTSLLSPLCTQGSRRRRGGKSDFSHAESPASPDSRHCPLRSARLAWPLRPRHPFCSDSLSPAFLSLASPALLLDRWLLLPFCSLAAFLPRSPHTDPLPTSCPCLAPPVQPAQGEAASATHTHLPSHTPLPFEFPRPSFWRRD